MSETAYFSEDEVHGEETVDEVVELPNGEKGKIEVVKVGLDVTDELGEKEEQGVSEAEIVQEVFDKYVKRPELDVTDMPADRADAFMEGVFKAWGVSEDDLDELIEDRQGN